MEAKSKCENRGQSAGMSGPGDDQLLREFEVLLEKIRGVYAADRSDGVAGRRKLLAAMLDRIGKELDGLRDEQAEAQAEDFNLVAEEAQREGSAVVELDSGSEVEEESASALLRSPPPPPQTRTRRKLAVRSKQYCAVCQKVYPTEISLHVHYKVAHASGGDGNTSSKPPSSDLNCDLCSYTTRLPSRLRHHIRHAHVDNGPFQCGVCSKEIFGGRRVFQRHLQLHARDHRDHVCDYCSKEFVSADRLGAHVRGVHMARTHQCDKCPKLFGTKFGLRRHVAAVHEAAALDKKAYECKKYSTVNSFLLHESSLNCIFTRCDYSTSFLSNLTAHVRRVHKIEGFTAGRTTRKILGASRQSHRKAMLEKAEAETAAYLAELSARRGTKVTIAGGLIPLGIAKNFVRVKFCFLDLRKEDEERRKTDPDGEIETVVVNPAVRQEDADGMIGASDDTVVKPEDISDEMLKELILRLN